MILSINQFASSGLQPARTYMLDIPVEVSRQRLLQRLEHVKEASLDRIEQKSTDYHERVREGFLRISESDSERVLLVNADRSKEIIAEEILYDCKRFLVAVRQ